MYDSLKHFTVKRAHFRCVITNVQLYNMHPYLNYYEGMESILVQDLENLDTGEYIAKFYWLNNNTTFRKLNLQQGDIITFTAKARFHRLGREYSRCNYYRSIRTTYRLVFPSSVQVEGHIDIPNVLEDYPVFDIHGSEYYTSFNEYFSHTKYKDKEFLIVCLVDSSMAQEVFFNRNGNLNSPNNKPYIIFDYVLNKLPVQQRIQLEYIQTPPRPIKE